MTQSFFFALLFRPQKQAEWAPSNKKRPFAPKLINRIFATEIKQAFHLFGIIKTNHRKEDNTYTVPLIMLPPATN